MSKNGIGALERGDRRTPQRETLALLVTALGLDPTQRRAFEEAARPAPARTNGNVSFMPPIDEESKPTNLPRQLTSFIGRDAVAAETATLIERSALVTLVGPGGVGKTRCALEVGARLLDDFGDGVWLADLSRISDESLVANVIARALSVQELPNRTIVETLVANLKRKHMLLVLDNCDHVIGEVRRVATDILDGCSDVRLLATSRERLRLVGEEVQRILPLSVPAAIETVTAADVSRFSALQLFVARAGSIEKRFAWSDDNALDVARICRRVDGIPFAIELAAARMNVLSPAQLVQMLDDRFGVLGSDTGALPRHQTLRALIDWSYDLLAEDQRLLLRKLSIFAGGFTLESATAVCSEDRIIVLDRLSSLVDKSLVQAEPGATGMRYRLLESTREYAREKLAASGDHATVARAHASAYLELAQQLDEDYDVSPDGLEPRVEPELENWQAALSWTLEQRGDLDIGRRLAGSLRHVYWMLGESEGRRWVAAALASSDADTPASVVAKLEVAKAVLDDRLSDHKARLAAAERAWLACHAANDQRGIADAGLLLARAMLDSGRFTESECVLEEALAATRELKSPIVLAGVLHHLAIVRDRSNDLAGARANYYEARAICQAIGADRHAAIITGNLADAEFHGGDVQAALRLAGEALAAHRKFNRVLGIVVNTCNIAAYLVASDRSIEARAYAREALLLARDREYKLYMIWALQHLTAIAALFPVETPAESRFDGARAARLCGYVAARWSALEVPRDHTERQEWERLLAALQLTLDETQRQKLMDEGRMWSEEQAIREALLV